MPSKALTVEEYLKELPAERKEAITKLRNEILKNIPNGYEERMAYGMIGYVVPHSLYPKGYHCDPKLPLGMMMLASQKTAISLHHMGLYANKKLLDWFVKEYEKNSTVKLDMGKGCVRFKKTDAIPYKLIGELAGKITVNEWIEMYEKAFKK